MRHHNPFGRAASELARWGATALLCVRLRGRGFCKWHAVSALLCVCVSLLPVVAQAQGAPVTVIIDAAANRRPISPYIYGVAHADAKALLDLNVPLNRHGGNNTSRYNWKLNADNRANDWYFESIADESAEPGERGDTFIKNTQSVGAQPMLTIPMLDWVAKVGPNREKTASFLVSRYGPQQKIDPYWPDAGNGVKPDGKEITGNDPNEANTRNSIAFQKEWVQHLVKRWGRSDRGGLRWYILDNEPGIWHGTHRDVQPVGIKARALKDRIIEYAKMIKSVDPEALVVGPEEWGWTGYIYSPYDHWYGGRNGWENPPDRAAIGNRDFQPWLLEQLRKYQSRFRRRLLDVFSLHIYPQGGEFGDDVSPAMQLRRNRSTRALWDDAYTDETWIKEKVRLIPRMREWVRDNYPGTLIGVTEYNWGAEKHINGAIAQADILGIFGREGLDLANRWTTPAPDTPTYKAIKLYRNYDGRKSSFGDTSVAASAPDPDALSVFAALRATDGALTVMAVCKTLSGETPVSFSIARFASGGPAQVWQLTAANEIKRLDDAALSGGRLRAALPAQSVTLFVLPPEKRP